MGTISATCHDCGDVELTSAEVTVRLCIDNGAGSYLFRCPQCVLLVAKPAEPRIVELLTASGCRLQEWKLPAELFEPRLGPPICHDDLIDFHTALEAL